MLPRCKGTAVLWGLQSFAFVVYLNKPTAPKTARTTRLTLQKINHSLGYLRQHPNATRNRAQIHDQAQVTSQIMIKR